MPSAPICPTLLWHDSTRTSPLVQVHYRIVWTLGGAEMAVVALVAVVTSRGRRMVGEGGRSKVPWNDPSTFPVGDRQTPGCLGPSSLCASLPVKTCPLRRPELPNSLGVPGSLPSFPFPTCSFPRCLSHNDVDDMILMILRAALNRLALRPPE
jgi:hypothetical protein